MNLPRNSAEVRLWVSTWRGAGAALAEVKRAELSRLSTADALRQLAAAFDSATSLATPTSTTGLIEQQAIFQRLRR